MSLAVSLGLVALVAAIYAATVSHPFVALDDDVYVLGNPHVARGLSAADLAWAFTHAYAANWHPFTWISHMVDAQLFGTTMASAGGHHAVSLVLHAANAALLFVALRLLTGQFGASAFVAALFAVHPLRVESVAWVSERKDVLSGLFFMLALLAYARHARQPGPRGMRMVLAAQVAGLLSKPTLVTLPLVLLVLDAWPLHRMRQEKIRSLLVEKIPCFAASVVLGVVTIAAQRGEGAVAALATIPWAARVANAAVSIATYLGKSLWPSDLSCFYPHPATLAPSPVWPYQVAGSTLLLAALSVGAFRFRQRHPYLLAGWLWFLVMLAPVIGILQVGNQAWADRYAYLPLIGIHIALTWLAIAWMKRRAIALRRAVVAGGMAALLALAFVAQRQTRMWSSTQALYGQALRVTPNNWFAENALGVLAMNQGRADEALTRFQKSLEDLAPGLRGGYREAHNNLGLLFIQQGRYDDARRELEQVLAAESTFPEAHNNMALLSLRQGRLEAARSHASRAIALRPEFVDAHFNLALALQAEGHLEEAVRHFEQVVALQPADAEAHAQLGRALAALGRLAEARAHLLQAVRLDPDHPWARQTLAELERAP